MTAFTQDSAVEFAQFAQEILDGVNFWPNWEQLFSYPEIISTFLSTWCKNQNLIENIDFYFCLFIQNSSNPHVFR